MFRILASLASMVVLARGESASGPAFSESGIYSKVGEGFCNAQTGWIQAEVNFFSEDHGNTKSGRVNWCANYCIVTNGIKNTIGFHLDGSNYYCKCSSADSTTVDVDSVTFAPASNTVCYKNEVSKIYIYCCQRK